MPTLDQLLQSAKLAPFGFTMPILATQWTSGNVTVNENDMSLASSANWNAPASGTFRRVLGPDMGVTLVTPSGTPLKAKGMLLTLFAPVWLRLSRCYAADLESSKIGSPVRPVPRYFFFDDPPLDEKTDPNGQVLAGTDTGKKGNLTVYDDCGMPIDPVGAAAAFFAILTARAILKSDPNDNQPLSNIFTNINSETLLRLSDHAGMPFGNDKSWVTGITATVKAAGLFTVDQNAGKVELSSDTNTLPAADKRLLALGAATTGRLSDSFSPPALPQNVTLKRDFFSLRVVSMKPWLLGKRPAYSDPKANLEPEPSVRVHEPLDIWADGNDVLGACAAALSGATESIAVAQKMDTDFVVPGSTGDNAHWPKFPAPSGNAVDAKLTPKLRDSFQPKANFVDDGQGGAQVDVVLTLQGLPGGASARVYPRKWIEDAREARGDGAGGIVPDNGKDFKLLLKDPLGLRPVNPNDQISVPKNAVLRFDVAVVKRDGSSRIYGDVVAPIGSTKVPVANNASNAFGGATHRGVSNAGVLGLGRNVGDLSNLDALTVLKKLTGESQPRDATRWPTMARRELIAAGLAGGKWRAVLAGGRLTGETQSAEARLGSPGGIGGRETQVTGLSTQNAPLAYDIARAGFRRSADIITRLIALADDAKWKEPAEPAALAVDVAPTADAGTIAAAVLQTIAPFCETPELNAIRSFIDPQSYPKTFDGLVDFVAQKLGQNSTLSNALSNLKGNEKGTRLYDELHREVMSSAFGRRDAQWALAGAIAAARNFIYIEGPAFASTQKDYGMGNPPEFAADLLGSIKKRMADAPGLHVIICTAKYPDFAPGYEPFAAHEAGDRFKQVNSLATAVDPQRIMAFHPVGFPGRCSRLESTVVIVDDVWALLGSSTFRRRGLTFDGGTDLVLTDTDLSGGRSKAISDFRRRLLAARLGIQPGDKKSPDPRWVLLRDGVEAFYVVRDVLRAGGLGKLDKLWNGTTPGVDPVQPLAIDLASPDGREFSDPNSGFFLAILALAKLATLSAY